MKRSLLLLPLALSGVAVSLSTAAVADDATKGVTPPPHFRQEGRPAEPVPAGADSVPLAPPPAAAGVQVGAPGGGGGEPQFGGVLYEKNRIKRTVPLDVAGGLDGRWDVLYTYVDSVNGTDTPGGSGVRTVYCDWDDNYLYLGYEAPKATDVRFDIDAQNDGWLRGADNLSIQVSPPAAGGTAAIVTAQRFDTLQNKERPVYADSPIPATDMKAQAGTTARGTYGVTLAVPKTELLGLMRRPGTQFGLRVESGLLPAQVGAADVLSIQPMLRLTLADAVPASSDTGLTLRVDMPSGHDNVPGEDVRAVLEAKNTGKTPLHIARLFLRGSLGTLNDLDSATFNGIVLNPGQSVKRDLRSAVAATADTGSYVVAGGAEWEDGTSIASLASFDRLEPYGIDFHLDQSPVTPQTAEHRTDDRKGRKMKKERPALNGTVRVAVVSPVVRARDRQSATVRLGLPDGWTLESDTATRNIDLRFAGDTRPQYFRIVVPYSAAPGTYPITATIQVAGRTYTLTKQLTVQAASGANSTAHR